MDTIKARQELRQHCIDEIQRFVDNAAAEGDVTQNWHKAATQTLKDVAADHATMRVLLEDVERYLSARMAPPGCAYAEAILLTRIQTTLQLNNFFWTVKND